MERVENNTIMPLLVEFWYPECFIIKANTEETVY